MHRNLINRSVRSFAAGGACLALVALSFTFSASAATVWGSSGTLPSPVGAASTTNVEVGSLACPVAFACQALIDIHPSGGGDLPYVTTERNHIWSPPVAVKLPANSAGGVFALSCYGIGDCTAVGDYYVGITAKAFSLTETSGVWGTAALLPVVAGSSYNTPTSISCNDAEDCVAVGLYLSSANVDVPLLEIEALGVWSESPVVLPTNAATPKAGELDDLLSVSCPVAGNCTAVGSYDATSGAQTYAVSESASTWSQGVPVAQPLNAYIVEGAGAPALDSVTCPSAGNCVAVGSYPIDRGVSSEGVLASETSGVWTRGVEAILPTNAVKGSASSPQTVTLNDVACASALSCTTVGSYIDDAVGDAAALTISGTTRSFSPGVAVVLPLNAATASQNASNNAIACPTLVSCQVVGTYIGSKAERSFVAVPLTKPTAPFITKMTATTSTVKVFFTAPKNDGGASVTSYQYSITAGVKWIALKVGIVTSPLVITQLKAKTTYHIEIRAVTPAGWSVASNAKAIRTL